MAGRHNQQPRPIISLRLHKSYHTPFIKKIIIKISKYNTSGVLPKNAKHACCIVSFFHFHEARAVLHYNGVKTNISPRVFQHAENIVNNPLLVRSGGEKNTSSVRDWNGAHGVQGQTRRGFASQPSGTEAGEERIPEWDVPRRRTRVCPLPGGELW